MKIGFAESRGSVSFRIKRPSPVTVNSQASCGTNEFLEVGRGPEGPKVATEAVSEFLTHVRTNQPLKPLKPKEISEHI